MIVGRDSGEFKLLPRVSRWTCAYLALVAFSVLGSWLSQLLKVDPGDIGLVSAWATLLVGTKAVFARAWVDRPAIYAVLLLGLIVEVWGSASGLPFGRYTYTSRWAPVIPNGVDGEVPLALPVAWLMMVGASSLTVARLRWSRPYLALSSGFLAALADLVMEPVMVGKLHYWRWIEPGPLPGGAPIMNFVGWFLTASVGAVLVLWSRPNEEPATFDAPIVLAGHLTMVFGIAASLR